jgi:hypothetical protein
MATVGWVFRNIILVVDTASVLPDTATCSKRVLTSSGTSRLKPKLSQNPSTLLCPTWSYWDLTQTLQFKLIRQAFTLGNLLY